MSLTTPPNLSSELVSIAQNLARASDLSEGDIRLRSRILDHLTNAELLTLHTAGQHRWPVVHCMHFASYSGSDEQPVIYMFTHENTRKLSNIKADARVALSLFRGRESDAVDGAAYLLMRGVAQLVVDDDERELAMEGQFNKPGYGFARSLGLETQPAIRVDVVEARYAQSLHDVAQTVSYRCDK